MTLNACTIVARNYLPLARVLARSLREQHPEARLTVLLVDDVSGQVDGRGEPFDLLHLAELDLGDPAEHRRMAMIYDVLELSTAVKPFLIRHLLSRGAEAVVYFDPDIRVYHPMGEVVSLAQQHTIVLTPHATSPIPRDGRRTDEHDILQSGIYNLGFVAVGVSGSADFLDWWSAHLRRDCLVDPERHVFVDQRWMDFVPGYWSPYLLRDETYNVAYWNVYTRPCRFVDGRWTVKGKPLRFFHFSGFDPRRPWILSRYQGDTPRVLLSQCPELARLCAEYAAEVMAAGYAEMADLAYGWGELANGVRCDRVMRRLYREELVAAERTGAPPPPDPYTREGAVAFIAWLNQPAPARVRPEITRYLHGLWASRPDLQSSFRDLAGRDAESFLDWVRHHGRREMGIPAALIPPVGPHPSARRFARSDDGPRPGYNVAGYLRAEHGVGEAARALLAALDASGIPTSTVLYQDTLARQQHPFRPPEDGDAAYDVNVVCVNADEFAGFAVRVGESFFAGRYTIGMWAWETEELPEAMRGSLNLVDEVWMGSRHSRDAVQRVTDKPVFAFPLPVVTPRVSPTITRADLGLPEDRFIFLFCFDLLSVMRRKNPLGLIEAFSRAFAPDEGPLLVIKTVNGEHRLLDLEELRAAAGRRPDVLVVDRWLTVDEKNALMAHCDCYVSLHRAEGFGLTMAEAMALGKPVIATAYSGNLEYMTEDNAYLVDWSPVEIGTGALPYPAQQWWADPDLDAAARWMRHVVDHPEEARARGERARADIAERHSPQARVDFLRQRLNAAEAELDRRRRRRNAVVAPLPQPVVASLAPTERQAYEALIAGPDVGSVTRRGGIYRVAVRWARRTVLRALHHYDAHQRRVGLSLLQAAHEAANAGRLAADAAEARIMERLQRLTADVDLQGQVLAALRRDLGVISDEITAPPYVSDPRQLRTVDDRGRETIGIRAGANGHPGPGYLGFEELFRGSEDLIRERLRGYLFWLRGCEPVVDLGCGRGEMLDLLAEAGMEAIGVDRDADMVARARAKGHLVEHDDALAYLASQPDASLGAVFSAQFVEHLEYTDLVRLVELVRRKLRPEGVFVAETVNPHSLRALRAFWLDPTHRSPLYPEALVTLCRSLGFVEAYVVFPMGRGDLEADRTTQGEYAVIARLIPRTPSPSQPSTAEEPAGGAPTS